MSGTQGPAMRFHLDESMHNAVADGLRSRNRDCTTAKQAGLIAARDDEHLAYALAEGRVIITRDEDFLILDAEGTSHAGIIYWCEKTHFGQLIKDLDTLCFAMSAEEMRGKVVFL